MAEVLSACLHQNQGQRSSHGTPVETCESKAKRRQVKVIRRVRIRGAIPNGQF